MILLEDNVELLLTVLNGLLANCYCSAAINGTKSFDLVASEISV
jgi:hypothetical protein